MKRLLTILTMVMMTLAAIAQTSTITMNGITYELYDATMTATIKDGGCSGIVYVDETFRMMQNSYTVTAVADNAFMGNSSITEVMLPNTVKTIGASAFDGCTSLQRINIPRNLESIGSDAFDRCEALQPIQLIQADPGVIPSDDDLQQAMTHWLSIRFGSDRANPLFYAHRLTGTSEEDIITEVNIPESITEIYAWAFAGGQDITTVNFPSPSDEAKALSKAKSADDQEFKIGYGAFYGCEKLIISKLPVSVKEIKPSTFEGCRSIVEFNVHEGIRAVGSRAFAGCIGLKDFFCLTSYVPEAQGDTFEDSSVDEATLYVSTDMVEEFSDAEGWKDFGNIEAYLTEEEKAELLATDFFAMTAVDGDVNLYMNSENEPESFSLQVSFDKLTWSKPIYLDGSQDLIKIVDIPAGETVYFRRYGETATALGKRIKSEEKSLSFWRFNTLNVTNNAMVDISGNIMSLLDSKCKSTTMAEAAFVRLFFNCPNLRNAKDLKLGGTLAPYCYMYIFEECKGMISAPELPATTLEHHCYFGMFINCTSLTTAPELPATTLADECYTGLFWGCTSLTTAPELPATTLSPYCYRLMFAECTNLNTAPALPATRIDVGCYENMFQGCTSLTTAPALPATELIMSCYFAMFYGCTNLNSVPTLPAEIAYYWNIYNIMFSECPNIKTLTIKLENYVHQNSVVNCLKDTKSPFTLICPQILIDRKGMAQIKKDFGLRLDDNIVALEVIESAILDDENHTATLTQGTKERNGQSSAIRLTFPDKITVDGEDYEVVAIAPEAFDDLEGVKEIVIECSRVPEIAPDAFDGKDVSGITLFVPEELVDDYRNTEPWSRFWPNIIPIREHVTTPQGEFIINNVDETADMISGGKPEDRPTVIVIPATVEHDGRTYPVTKVEPEVFADLSGIEEIFIHAEIVPYLDPHALDDKDLSGIILYVPDDLVEEYQNTYPWSLFPDIRPISEAGIETVTVGSAPVNMKYIENRRIVIRHNGRKYSVQGTLLR